MKSIRVLTIILIVGLTGLSGLRDVRASGGQFTIIDYPNALYTFASGINARGDIIGQYWDKLYFNHGFLLHQGQLTTIDAPNGGNTVQVTGINSHGDIVGFYNDPTTNTTRGFLLSHS